MSAAPARSMPALPARVPARRRRRAEPVRGHRPRNRVAGSARRTASVVTHLPETTAVVGISRTRLWIAVVGVLLIGIVAINVVTVSYGAMSGRIETQIQTIERQSSILKSKQTAALSMPEVQAAATQSGMLVPAPEEIRYLKSQPGDIAAAAQRLAAEGG